MVHDEHETKTLFEIFFFPFVAPKTFANFAVAKMVCL